MMKFSRDGFINKLPQIWFLIALLAVVAVSFIYRISPLAETDAITHEADARQLLDYGFLGEYWAPLRSWRAYGIVLFIAGIYKIAGSNPTYVIFVQMILFAAMVSLLVATVRNIDDSSLSANICGILCITYIPYHYYSRVLLTEQLNFFFVCIAIWLYSKLQKINFNDNVRSSGAFKIVMMMGIFFGLAAYVKGYIAYYPFLFATVTISYSIVSKSLSRRNRSVIRRCSVIFLLTYITVIAPYLVRNYLVTGVWNKIVTCSGYQLYLGNYSLSDGNWLRPVDEKYWVSFNRESRDLVKGKSEVEQDKVLLKAGAKLITNYPISFMKKALFQAVRTVTINGVYYEGSKLFKIVTGFQYLIITWLAFYGLFLVYKDGRKLFAAGCALFIVTHISLLSVTFSMNRLKEPLSLFFMCFAAIAVRQLFSRSFCRR